MATVSFLPDKQPPPIDEKLTQIGKEAALADRAIRVRVQPDLYSPDRNNYESWRGLVWTLDLESVDEGKRFRQGLERFIQAFGDPAKQEQVLALLEGL